MSDGVGPLHYAPPEPPLAPRIHEPPDPSPHHQPWRATVVIFALLALLTVLLSTLGGLFLIWASHSLEQS